MMIFRWFDFPGTRVLKSKNDEDGAGRGEIQKSELLIHREDICLSISRDQASEKPAAA
jgi:hypothetical protein